jgi:hypothetical protein
LIVVSETRLSEHDHCRKRHGIETGGWASLGKGNVQGTFLWPLTFYA